MVVGNNVPSFPLLFMKVSGRMLLFMVFDLWRRREQHRAMSWLWQPQEWNYLSSNNCSVVEPVTWESLMQLSAMTTTAAMPTLKFVRHWRTRGQQCVGHLICEKSESIELQVKGQENMHPRFLEVHHPRVVYKSYQLGHSAFWEEISLSGMSY